MSKPHFGPRKNAPPVRNPPTPTVAVAPAPAGGSLAAELRSTLAFLQAEHPLETVFSDAIAQATRGKGALRHGQGRDSTSAENFLAQDWRAIARRHGPGFLSGQAEKKLREALDLAPAERRTELLGVLVYVAMLVLHHDKSSAAAP